MAYQGSWWPVDNLWLCNILCSFLPRCSSKLLQFELLPGSVYFLIRLTNTTTQYRYSTSSHLSSAITPPPFLSLQHMNVAYSKSTKYIVPAASITPSGCDGQVAYY